MEKVADEFDKGDGMIDSKEFMAKLRSEFSKVGFYGNSTEEIAPLIFSINCNFTYLAFV